MVDSNVSEKSSSNIQQQIEKSVSLLKQGGVIVFPTDTVYGLGGASYLEQAIDKIYQVKKRPRNMALPLLLADMSQVNEVAEAVPEVAWVLAREFLPGALTLVLYKSKSVLDIITAGGNTVAIRIPAHPIPVAIIEGLGSPIVGTSANRSGMPSALEAKEVYSQLGNEVDLVIDGGRCSGGRESTIVDVIGEIPVILREGAISREEIEQVCGNILRKEAK